MLRDVIAARRFLTLMLDSLGRVVPDDPWIAGQRVYYLVALGNFDGALTAARECRAASAWCELLRGYAIQRSGHSIEAQTVFANAIAAMPAEDRCTWTDVSLLLDPETVRAYSAMPCESPERAAFEERFWMLADPSWLVSGNDRRAEHLARLVERNIQLDWSEAMHADTLRGPAAFATPPAALVLTGENDSWWIEGRPLYKLNPNPIPPDANLTKADSQRLQRCAAQECYHSGWTQASPGQVICAIGTEPVVRQRLAKSWKEPGSSWLQWTSNQQCARLRPVGVRYHFAPLAHALTTPFAASPADWDLNAGPPIDEILQPVLGKEETPLPERYTPLYAAHVTHIPSWQVAFFRRGDSAVVAGVFDVTSDSAFDHLLATSRRGANQAPPSRARWMAGLFVNARSVDAGAPFRQTLARLDGAPVARWAATAAAPWDSVLLGLELLTPNDSAHGGGVLARERFGVAPPSEPVQRVQLSDILMYAPGTDLPHALVGANGALGSAFGSTTVSGRRTVGLYWEAYGERSLETERVTLTVVQLARDQGVLGEVWSAVTRAGVAPPVDLNWTDQAPSVNPRDPLGNVGRAVTINIGGLESGRYAVRLTVAVDGQAPVAVTRTFSVRSP